MKVLLVGEGKNDLEGVLPVMVRRLSSRTDLDFIPLKWHETRRRAHPGKGTRLEKRILGWVEEARDQRCGAIVLVIDRDRDRARGREIDRARQSASEPEFGVPHAIGLAIESIEAWLLADQQALSSVTGCNVAQQPDPEGIERPKEHLHALIAKLESAGEMRWNRADTEFYAAVCEQANLDTLKRRCPDGFGAWAVHVEGLKDVQP